MRRSNAPTLQDVADAAGVSVMMASVVVNGAQSSTRVASATRERILEAASRLRYRRNAVAHGLSRQRMDAIGVTAIIDSGEMNLYFLEVLNGILEAAAEHGQNTTIFALSDWVRDAEKLADFCDRRVDGMILIAPDLSSPEVFSHHTPFVTIHGNEREPTVTNLDIDNEGGAFAITQHLIEAGHRRIAHFPGNGAVVGVTQRIAGYRRAHREAGLPVDESLIFAGNFSVSSGRERGLAMLERFRSEDLPTAIFCASDAIAFGCMEVLAGHGLRVPDDISIAGFDDTLMARMTRPPLTTMRQPFREMGRCAVEKLLLLIDPDRNGAPAAEAVNAAAPIEAYSPEPRTHIFPVELVVRESVGPPRAART